MATRVQNPKTTRTPKSSIPHLADQPTSLRRKKLLSTASPSTQTRRSPNTVYVGVPGGRRVDAPKTTRLVGNEFRNTTQLKNHKRKSDNLSRGKVYTR